MGLGRLAEKRCLGMARIEGASIRVRCVGVKKICHVVNDIKGVLLHSWLFHTTLMCELSGAISVPN